MSANATDSSDRSATTQQQAPVPKKIVNAQTVCNEKNEKGKLCNGHLKQLQTGGEPSEVHLRGDDVLFKCQACGTLYMGPPHGHVRDPFKQQRFTENELAAILQAAGGTLPAIVKNEKGVYVLKEEAAHHAPAKAAAPPAKPAPKAAAPAAAPAAPKPSAPAATTPPVETKATAPVAAQEQPAATVQETPAQPKPVAAPAAPAAKPKTKFGPIPGATGPVPGETFEQKLERLRGVVAEAKRRAALLEAEGEGAAASIEAETPVRTTPATASTSGTDSSAQADLHRPAAEAQAATGQASAVPLSPAAATASPAAGAETPADLAPDAVTEKKEAAPAPKAASGGGGLHRAPFDTGPVPGETHEQKIERLKQVVAAAKARAEAGG